MSDTERLIASRNTLRVAAVVSVISAIRIAIDTTRYGFWPLGAFALVHALGAAGLAMWLRGPGARWSVRASDLAYVLVLVPHLLTFWLTQMYDDRAGTLVEPLVPHHTLLIAIALVPPINVRWGFGLLALVTAHGVTLWAVLADAVPSSTLGREPWFTLIVAGVSIGTLWSRRLRRELELRLAIVEARADALDRLNRMLFALRDRANTPLQTLEIAIGLLEQQSPDGKPVPPSALTAMRRAMAQLVDAQKPLSTAVISDRAELLSVDLARELRELHEPRGRAS